MKNTLNYNSNQHLNYNAEQLRLPLDLSVKIDKNDPMWSFLEIVREVNINRYLKAHRGNKGHDGRMMLRVVLFAYMNGVYSLREMEEKCRTDIRFMYLSEETCPSFMAFQRFIANSLKENISDIFTDITETITAKLNINIRVLYIDGTALEANARKFSFVWKKTCEKSLKKSSERAREIIEKLQEQTGIKYIWTDLFSYHIEEYEDSIREWCKEQKIEFVYGKGKRKTEVQRLYDQLEKERQKITECTEKINICGPDRNSYSKTDHDATFMHMKYDYYMKTGVFKPGYNVQLGESEGLIRNIRVGQERSDSTTYIPFMNGYKERYGELPGIVVADAGYGSYENYMYNIVEGIGSYIKYNSYANEKTAKYQKKKYHSKNLLHEENGELYCPNNKRFIYQGDKVSTKGAYLYINQNYECESCEGCPYKPQCTKASGNRTYSKNVILEEMHSVARNNLDSEAGIQLRQQRSIQAEGTFGVIKQDLGYVRIHRRGIENVENEIYLVCIGFNLRKYHRRRIEKLMN